ncbi:DUF6778 family protein [Phaeovulum sp.]|uniref:DUF6778 family protein n=1 Tax=Phaeovulum sp. TaxID=2934796 RepID=UPI003565CE7A
MRIARVFTAFALVGALGACMSSDPASRASTAPDGLGLPGEGQIVAIEPRYAIKDVTVRVPETLKVSEANLYYPIADIVWRGDPRGNRYEQIKAIFDTAAAQATAGMNAGQAVNVEIEVTRFHAQTEKTRYSVGGTFSMHFLMTVRDAATGAIIDGPREVDADTPAAGGEQALAEEAQGLTAKVVVTARLTEVIAAELSRPVLVSAPPQLAAN